MGKDYDHRDDVAPFNMAIATLMRLDVILKQIKSLSSLLGDKISKQELHIDLVKQFFINAVPLLEGKTIKKFESHILALEIKRQTTIRNGIQGVYPKYNQGLEIELNKILINLQFHLKKYFMPTGKDPGKAIGF